MTENPRILPERSIEFFEFALVAGHKVVAGSDGVTITWGAAAPFVRHTDVPCGGASALMAVLSMVAVPI